MYRGGKIPRSTVRLSNKFQSIVAAIRATRHQFGRRTMTWAACTKVENCGSVAAIVVGVLLVIPPLLASASPDKRTTSSLTSNEVRALHSLLTTSGGKRITTAAEWEQQRAKIKKKWQLFLGELPTAKPPLDAHVLSTEQLAGFKRSRVKYQVEPGVYTDGYLLEPIPARKQSAAVIVFHPTTPLQAKGVAGVDDSYEPDKRQGMQLVKDGFVVWCPRNYINTDGADWAGNARRVQAAHPGWTGMTRMVLDAVRAADFVQSLPAVDRNRIGCLGHSLGAKVVLYAMAFDERYKAGVFSEGGIGLKCSNWDAPWYLGPKIREKDFDLENDQILALVAPRGFLALAGGSADGERSRALIDEVVPVYELYGAAKRLEWQDHHRGHAYPPEAREAAEGFLTEQLK
jgi:dienelactone hydrolase